MTEAISDEVKNKIFKLVSTPGVEIEDIPTIVNNEFKSNLDYEAVMKMLSDEYLKHNLGKHKLKNGIVKFATHGFWGSVDDLIRLYVMQGNEYIVQHMTKIKEAIRQGKQPRIMETQHRILAVNWQDEYGLCGYPKTLAIQNHELCTQMCLQCPYC